MQRKSVIGLDIQVEMDLMGPGGGGGGAGPTRARSKVLAVPVPGAATALVPLLHSMLTEMKLKRPPTEGELETIKEFVGLLKCIPRIWVSTQSRKQLLARTH